MTANSSCSQTLAAYPCPACSSDSTKWQLQLRSPYVAGAKYDIYSCFQCEHKFARGPCDADTLRAVYNEAFHGTVQQRAYTERSPIVLNARHRAAELSAAGLSGRLIDIGAGRGHFVHEAARFFEALGLEYSNAAVNEARNAGINVIEGDYPGTSVRGGPFDVLTMWDVLAGLCDLDCALAKSRELLSPGGYFVFTVPYVSSLPARLLGRYWPLWIPPVNLHYFSCRSIRAALRRHGFVIRTSGTAAKRVAVSFLLHKAFRAAGHAPPKTIMRLIPPTWSISLDLGDILTVWAQRR